MTTRKNKDRQKLPMNEKVLKFLQEHPQHELAKKWRDEVKEQSEAKAN